MWSHYYDAGSVVQSQICLLLKYSVQMENVLSETAGTNYLEPAILGPFMEHCERFLVVDSAVHQSFAADHMRLFNITPKLDLLWHACWGGQWLHPRLTWCYSGFNLKSATLQTSGIWLQGTVAALKSVFAQRTAFAGEGHMQHSRRLAQGCLRGCAKWHAVKQMTEKFVRGFTFKMQRAGRAVASSTS